MFDASPENPHHAGSEGASGVRLRNPAPSDGEAWHCVRTGPRQELTADIQIRLAGFTLFAPSVWKPATRPCRGANGVTKPGSPDRIVPLFPRYLFVRFRRSDPGWRRIWSMPGVDCILGISPGAPTAVPDQAIEVIRGLCAPNDCIYPASHGERPAPLTPGTRARMLTGPMAEVAGICQWSDGKRVRLLLTIMGRAVAVTVPQAALELA
jgi:transcription antitermination factor NusG